MYVHSPSTLNKFVLFTHSASYLVGLARQARRWLPRLGLPPRPLVSAMAATEEDDYGLDDDSFDWAAVDLGPRATTASASVSAVSPTSGATSNATVAVPQTTLTNTDNSSDFGDADFDGAFLEQLSQIERRAARVPGQ